MLYKPSLLTYLSGIEFANIIMSASGSNPMRAKEFTEV